MLDTVMTPAKKRSGILLATTNPAKMEKLRWMLDGLGLEFHTPMEISNAPIHTEDGYTHLENAEAKAVLWSDAFEGLAVATDGGLVIPALGDSWDSLRTARFAGQEATDAVRAKKLLEMMAHLQGEKRVAFWVESVALADQGDVLMTWEAHSAKGYIVTEADPAKVKPGFWAFSLWRMPEFSKVYAELTPEELHKADDHWGHLRERVREYFRMAKPR